MPIPQPEPGLVIHYEYLWRHEHLRGAEYGRKGRPCAVIVAVTDGAGVTEATVAPITHIHPAPPSEGVEIPARVKRHLGLDDQRSWIVTTDLNVFIWPGADLLPVPNRTVRSYAYGFLPSALFEMVRKRVAELMRVVPATRRQE